MPEARGIPLRPDDDEPYVPPALVNGAVAGATSVVHRVADVVDDLSERRRPTPAAPSLRAVRDA